jgi:hypothetical protein
VTAQRMSAFTTGASASTRPRVKFTSRFDLDQLHCEEQQ